MRANHSILIVLLIVATATVPAHAAGVSAAPRGTKAVPSRHAATPAVRRAATAASTEPKRGPGPAAARTLDPIHIEGELDVPEVLFITARDQRRIVEFQHRRYLPAAAEDLHGGPAPVRVMVTRRPATPEGEAR